jgi:serine/threonine protein kinase
MNAAATQTRTKPLDLRTESGVRLQINPSDEFARGGEGWIATIQQDRKHVAKIYHDQIKQRMSKTKFSDLVKLPRDLFVIPKELLFDSSGAVQGFLMDYIDINGYYPVERIYKKVFCQQEGITDKVKTTIVKNIIEGVKVAHDLDIVIGDLNPYNILANKNGDVKFIDVDSYQTPKVKHTGIMLEEITDFLHNRVINKESDYFALSCMVFNLITLVHPFKGIHKDYKSIKDRMIHKLPLFKKGEPIKIPKFYQPLQDKHMISQFERFYLNGERAILLLDAQNSFIATSPLAKPVKVIELQEGSISIKEIVDDPLIYDVFVLGNKFVVKSQTGFRIYNASNKGYVKIERRVSKSDFDDVFIGDKYILAKKGMQLFNISDENSPVEVMNFKFHGGDVIKQQRNVLLVQRANVLEIVNIDKTYGKVVDVDQQSMTYQNMNMVGGMFHSAGGKQLLVNVSNRSNVNLILSPVNVTEAYQVGSAGIVKYLNEKGKVRMKYYKINGLDMKLSNGNCGDMYHFGYLEGKDNEGFVFQPQDGFIRVIRTNDFEEVSRLDCSVCTSQSFIKNTTAGMVVWEDEKVLLINKR